MGQSLAHRDTNFTKYAECTIRMLHETIFAIGLEQKEPSLENIHPGLLIRHGPFTKYIQMRNSSSIFSQICSRTFRVGKRSIGSKK